MSSEMSYWERYGAESLREEIMANEPIVLGDLVDEIFSEYKRNLPVTQEDVKYVFRDYPWIFGGSFEDELLA